jgi:hypothetical protein
MESEGFLDDLMTDIKDFFYTVSVELVDLTADLIEQIPVPEFIQPLGQFISDIPPEIAYFVAPMQLPYAFTVIMSAIAARQLLSLIPYIGGAFR